VVFLPTILSPATSHSWDAPVSAACFTRGVAARPRTRPWWRGALGLPWWRACRVHQAHPHRHDRDVDGGRGEVILEPDTEIQGRFADRAARDLVQTERLAGRVRRLPSRSMGSACTWPPNVELLEEIPSRSSWVRRNRAVSGTEFLYLERSTLPPRRSSTSTRWSALRAMNGRDVCFRRPGLGGDKLPLRCDPGGNTPRWACARFRYSLWRRDVFRVSAARLFIGCRGGPVCASCLPLISGGGRAAHGARLCSSVCAELPARRAGTQSRGPAGM